MLVQEFCDITQANSNLVAVQVSPHERIGDAMLIHPSIPSPHKVADEAWREIAHYHGHKDYSMHITLSPQDCKLGEPIKCNPLARAIILMVIICSNRTRLGRASPA